jgi:hypothetical protein
MKRYSISCFAQLVIFYFYTIYDCTSRQACLHWPYTDVYYYDGLKVLHGFTLHHRDTTSGMAGNGFLQLHLEGTLMVYRVSQSLYYLLRIPAQVESANNMVILFSPTGDKFEFCIMFADSRMDHELAHEPDQDSP